MLAAQQQQWWRWGPTFQRQQGMRSLVGWDLGGSKKSWHLAQGVAGPVGIEWQAVAQHSMMASTGGDMRMGRAV